MRASPMSMAILYFAIGILLIFFAIQSVGTTGWSFWTYLIIAFATMDFMIAIRFYRLRKVIKEIQNKSKRNKKK